MSGLHFHPDAILDATQVDIIPKGTPVDWNGARVLLRNGTLAQPPEVPDPLVRYLTLGLWALAIVIVCLVAFTVWEVHTERRIPNEHRPLRHRKVPTCPSTMMSR
jgi:hypothetical protein